VIGHVFAGALPVKTARSDQVRPKGFAAATLQIEGEIATVNGLAGTGGIVGTEGEIAFDPQLAGTVQNGVGIGWIIDKTKRTKGAEPADDFGAEIGGTEFALELIDANRPDGPGRILRANPVRRGQDEEKREYKARQDAGSVAGAMDQDSCVSAQALCLPEQRNRITPALRLRETRWTQCHSSALGP
jgi:hypothetical protein